MNEITAPGGSRVFKRSETVVSRNVGKEAILVPIANNVGNLDYVYTLSPVAARIWSLLDGSRDIDAIVDTLCIEYDTDRATASLDVGELLSDLAGAELVSPIS